MTGCPYLIEPLIQPTPIWVTVSDINSMESFFIFTDAAIKCHPFVLTFALVGSFFIGIAFTVFISKIIELYEFFHFYKKGGE